MSGLVRIRPIYASEIRQDRKIGYEIKTSLLSRVLSKYELACINNKKINLRRYNSKAATEGVAAIDKNFWTPDYCFIGSVIDKDNTVSLKSLVELLSGGGSKQKIQSYSHHFNKHFPKEEKTYIYHYKIKYLNSPSAIYIKGVKFVASILHQYEVYRKLGLLSELAQLDKYLQRSGMAAILSNKNIFDLAGDYEQPYLFAYNEERKDFTAYASQPLNGNKFTVGDLADLTINAKPTPVANTVSEPSVSIATSPVGEPSVGEDKKPLDEILQEDIDPNDKTQNQALYSMRNDGSQPENIEEPKQQGQGMPSDDLPQDKQVGLASEYCDNSDKAAERQGGAMHEIGITTETADKYEGNKNADIKPTSTHNKPVSILELASNNKINITSPNRSDKREHATTLNSQDIQDIEAADDEAVIKSEMEDGTEGRYSNNTNITSTDDEQVVSQVNSEHSTTSNPNPLSELEATQTQEQDFSTKIKTGALGFDEWNIEIPDDEDDSEGDVVEDYVEIGSMLKSAFKKQGDDK